MTKWEYFIGEKNSHSSVRVKGRKLGPFGRSSDAHEFQPLWWWKITIRKQWASLMYRIPLTELDHEIRTVSFPTQNIVCTTARTSSRYIPIARRSNRMLPFLAISSSERTVGRSERSAFFLLVSSPPLPALIRMMVESQRRRMMGKVTSSKLHRISLWSRCFELSSVLKPGGPKRVNYIILLSGCVSDQFHLTGNDLFTRVSASRP